MRQIKEDSGLAQADARTTKQQKESIMVTERTHLEHVSGDQQIEKDKARLTKELADLKIFYVGSLIAKEITWRREISLKKDYPS